MAETKRYAVYDHPLLVERSPDGSQRARLLDLRTGAFVTDDHYLHLVAFGGRGVEELAAGPFDRLVAALRMVASDDRQAERIVWERSVDDAGYRVEREGVVYSIRQAGQGNDERYVVVVDGQEVDRLDTWPRLWSKGVALRNELSGLLELVRGPGPVTGEVIRQHLAPRAAAMTTSGPNLQWPPWADRTGGAADIYVELGGPVAGARISQPHGQYVDLFVVDGSVVDVEAVVGPLKPTVKVHYDDPDVAMAYLTIEDQAVRVLVETRRTRATMVVTVHFP